ncbi:hypothetical protein [Paraburkholderia sp. BL21I4N1]|uniref:hypothetical protein n=1 Tax=Paraburkholderia sp. BL21I4N1 TaxID=1938801 RepID=UPI000D4C4F4B|nr:hypothetical protein [Paraburkholderia sp. BL21I4N1]PQV51817.1 hypothetical protein B0G83_10424 [Paraburkholderia sp. BL21I4N1]
MKTDRFEMRLEEDFAGRIDAWRDRHMSGASRAMAIRTLIERSLGGGDPSERVFTDGERTIIALMQPLFEKIGAPISDINAIVAGFKSGHTWIADQRMGSLYAPKQSVKADGDFVLEALEAWDIFERAFDALDEEGRASVLAPSERDLRLKEAGAEPPSREVKFAGFYAAREQKFGELAEFLTRSIGYFPRFVDRDMMGAQDTTLHHLQRKLDFYRSIKPRLIGGHQPSPQDIRKFVEIRDGVSWTEIEALRPELKLAPKWSS